jgi:heterotetrameric sarcosine oxidase delta subunit
MSFLLRCPNCGPREVTDFGFGGEVIPRPRSRPAFRDLNAYNYFRRNAAGVQREWWFHRSGCRVWFIAERDTRTNEVLFTARPSEVPGDGRVGRVAEPEGVGDSEAGRAFPVGGAAKPEGSRER